MSRPHDTVSVEGPDAETYLQGQVSQDVAGLDVGGAAWTFVLAPNGHIDAFASVVRDSVERFSFLIDPGYGAALEGRFRRFLLRTKAEITLREAADLTVLADTEAARIESGVLSMANEIDERTVPAETGWVGRAVSFTKGCYTGQELVARMDSRVAEPPRRLVRLEVSGARRGDLIVVAGAEAGAVTSAVGGVALGYLKRGTALDDAAEVGGAPATILGLVGA
ncbi:MAG: hypothetical protein H0U92_14650 [Actinobacteria bacterium]|nr:hypothetical protein [Actinomycetota bacterium]